MIKSVKKENGLWGIILLIAEEEKKFEHHDLPMAFINARDWVIGL